MKGQLWVLYHWKIKMSGAALKHYRGHAVGYALLFVGHSSVQSETFLEAHPVILYSCIDNKETNGHPTKGTKTSVVHECKKSVIQAVFVSLVLMILKIPAYEWCLNHLLFMAQWFPIDCWMLYCTVHRKKKSKKQRAKSAMFNLNFSLPYWEVLCVWCNVFIVLYWCCGTE